MTALDAWYGRVRSRIAQGHPDRAALYERGRTMVRLNLNERIAQLGGLAERMELSARALAARRPNDPRLPQHEALLRHWPRIEQHLRRTSAAEIEPPAEFLRALEASLDGGAERYTGVVRRLSAAGRAAGREWLAAIRDRVASPEILALVPAL